MPPGYIQLKPVAKDDDIEEYLVSRQKSREYTSELQSPWEHLCRDLESFAEGKDVGSLAVRVCSPQQVTSGRNHL